MVGNKPLGSIAWNNIDESCIWNQYKSLIIILLHPDQYYSDSYLKRKNLPIINSSNQSALFDLLGQIKVLVELNDIFYVVLTVVDNFDWFWEFGLIFAFWVSTKEQYNTNIQGR